MFSLNDKISTRQMQALLILTMFSSVSLILPRLVSEIAKQDGWIIIVGSTVFILIYAYFITSLGKMFPGKTIVEYSGEILTRPIGFLVSMVFLIKCIIFLGLTLRTFAELVKQTLLPNTPLEVILTVLLFSVLYLSRKGCECRARLGELILFITFVPIIIIMLLALKNIRLENFAPFFVAKSQDLFLGSANISFRVVGIEFLLILTAYVRSKRHLSRAVFQSIIIVMAIYLLLDLVTVGVFGEGGTTRQIWPVMTIMQVIEIPGSFIERQDALMMSFWIMTVYTLIGAYMFYSSVILSRILKTKESNWINGILLPIAYVISLIPDNVPATYETISKLSTIYGVAFLIPVPIILYIVAKIRKLGVKNETKKI